MKVKCVNATYQKGRRFRRGEIVNWTGVKVPAHFELLDAKGVSVSKEAEPKTLKEMQDKQLAVQKAAASKKKEIEDRKKKELEEGILG